MLNGKKCKLTHVFNNYFMEYLLNVMHNARLGIIAMNKTDIDPILMQFIFQGGQR